MIMFYILQSLKRRLITFCLFSFTIVEQRFKQTLRIISDFPFLTKGT